jgi:Fur family ferric uptake transcriptional regulator
MTRQQASAAPPEARATEIRLDGNAIDEVMSLIRERGGRSTTPRRAVLEELIRAAGDLRVAEQIVSGVQAGHPNIGDSTVYRTLDLLEELGLVSHVHLGHGPSHWYLSGNRRRWYLTCTHCGNATEADPAAFDSLATDVAGRTGFVLDAGHFAVTGICASCMSSAG